MVIVVLVGTRSLSVGVCWPRRSSPVGKGLAAAPLAETSLLSEGEDRLDNVPDYQGSDGQEDDLMGELGTALDRGWNPPRCSKCEASGRGRDR